MQFQNEWLTLPLPAYRAKLNEWVRALASWHYRKETRIQHFQQALDMVYTFCEKKYNSTNPSLLLGTPEYAAIAAIGSRHFRENMAIYQPTDVLPQRIERLLMNGRTEAALRNKLDLLKYWKHSGNEKFDLYSPLVRARMTLLQASAQQVANDYFNRVTRPVWYHTVKLDTNFSRTAPTRDEQTASFSAGLEAHIQKTVEYEYQINLKGVLTGEAKARLQALAGVKLGAKGSTGNTGFNPMELTKKEFYTDKAKEAAKSIVKGEGVGESIKSAIGKAEDYKPAPGAELSAEAEVKVGLMVSGSVALAYKDIVESNLEFEGLAGAVASGSGKLTANLDGVNVDLNASAFVGLKGSFTQEVKIKHKGVSVASCSFTGEGRLGVGASANVCVAFSRYEGFKFQSAASATVAVGGGVDFSMGLNPVGLHLVCYDNIYRHVIVQLASGHPGLLAEADRRHEYIAAWANYGAIKGQIAALLGQVEVDRETLQRAALRQPGVQYGKYDFSKVEDLHIAGRSQFSIDKPTLSEDEKIKLSEQALEATKMREADQSTRQHPAFAQRSGVFVMTTPL